MSEDTTQAVTNETQPPAQQGGAGAPDARVQTDDLDTLLNEFDTSSQQTSQSAQQTQPGQTGSGDDLKALTDQAKAVIEQHHQVTFRRDMNETLRKVRGSLDPEFFDDKFVEAWIDAQAREDPRLQQAWTQRHANQKQFEKVVEGLGRNFAKKYGKLPDKAATEDRAAVTAAVRGASTQAPEPASLDVSRMSDGEARAAIEKAYGYTPRF